MVWLSSNCIRIIVNLKSILNHWHYNFECISISGRALNIQDGWVWWAHRCNLIEYLSNISHNVKINPAVIYFFDIINKTLKVATALFKRKVIFQNQMRFINAMVENAWAPRPNVSYYSILLAWKKGKVKQVFHSWLEYFFLFLQSSNVQPEARFTLQWLVILW